MDNTAKELIRAELNKHVLHSGSQVKSAAKLKVSNATVSKIIAGKDDGLGDAMWVKISKQLGMRLDQIWYHADTRPAIKLRGYFDDARMHGNVFGLVCTPGSGKTDMLDNYVKEEKNVFYVKCERHMTEKELLAKILQSMGIKSNAGTVSLLTSIIKERVDKYKQPIIIIDEMEKVRNGLLLLFIDLYNALWKRCGIVLIGTHNLRDRIELGEARGSIGFNEILSRLGGKFIEIPTPDYDDAILVAKTNGVTDTESLAFIANGAAIKNGVVDMRRVERLVHAWKQKQAELEDQQNEEAAA
ncbi:ATP-binding protein [Mucilaginibacter sp. SMC90]|uniref:AAA family ATPase n=1 Tax=Mucilaginibacter sp. SMC90 TaxID=2929803 RepID=UPI001FB27138|nr:AAA family ATPase [Mucilaginibacter sp. SMC90]UOE48018.1 ATP-binding protein [Mucilaginibacter sp. SMC90]